MMLFLAFLWAIPEVAAAPVDLSDPVRASFARMHDAVKAGDRTAYGEQLRYHLSTLNGRDGDVAYLYAVYLHELGTGVTDAAELLRWANIAIANRDDWVGGDYTARLQRMYQLRLESTLALWEEASEDYQSTASDVNLERVNRFNDLAKRYFAVSGPCLVHGACGPRYVVEVDEGTTPCNQLTVDAMELVAGTGSLSLTQIGCMERRYEQPLAARARIETLLVDNARKAESEVVWKRLLDWVPAESRDALEAERQRLQRSDVP